MNEEKVLTITDKEELYDKCENMEDLFDKYYLPLLDIHYKKIYKLQQENQQLKEQLKKGWKPTPDDLLDMLNQELLEQLKQRDEVIDETIKYIKTKINNSFNYDYGFDTSNPSDRLFTETVIELQCILEILQKYKGDNK